MPQRGVAATISTSVLITAANIKPPQPRDEVAVAKLLAKATHLRLNDMNLNSLHWGTSNGKEDSPFDLLPALSTLYIFGNRLTSFDAITPLQRLESLYADDNQLSELNLPTSLRALKEVHVARNSIMKVVSLPPSLEELHMGYQLTGPVSIDTACMCLLPNLKLLDVSGCRLSSLGPFSGLKALSTLLADDNEIAEIDQVRNLSISLEELSLRRNPISERDILHTIGKRLKVFNGRELGGTGAFMQEKGRRKLIAEGVGDAWLD